jgi:hypothetical protein
LKNKNVLYTLISGTLAYAFSLFISGYLVAVLKEHNWAIFICLGILGFLFYRVFCSSSEEDLTKEQEEDELK